MKYKNISNIAQLFITIDDATTALKKKSKKQP